MLCKIIHFRISVFLFWFEIRLVFKSEFSLYGLSSRRPEADAEIQTQFVSFVESAAEPKKILVKRLVSVF